jgi:porphobilinogen synthase
VSGEYSTIMAAANNGWIEGDKALRGSCIAFERRDADCALSAMRIVDLERSRAKLVCLEAA